MLTNSRTRRLERVGATLIEVVLVIAILAVLIGLLIPAVAQVRETARVMHTMNQEKQIVLAVHQLSTDRDDQIRRMPQNTALRKPFYTESTVFTLILPYVHPPLVEPPLDAPKDVMWAYLAPQVKLYTDPQDPSLDSLNHVEGFTPTRRTRASYAANMMAFDGFLSLTSSLPDGLSNTIAFTTHYFHCGTDRATERTGTIYWNRVGPSKSAGEDRRASFADQGCRDVVPTRDPATGRTVPSRPGATFEVRPAVADADARLPHALYARGLQVAMFDGSVRTIRPTVDPSIFWAAVTPNWGEVSALPD
jgi:competence protein ComGC